MSIRFRCTCGASFDLRDDTAGQLLHCPQCGVPSRVPGDPNRIAVVSVSQPPPPAASHLVSALPPVVPPMISADMLTGSSPPGIAGDMLATGDASDTETDESRRDFEKGMSMSPVFTLAVIGINVAVFFLILGFGALESQEAIIRAGALSRPHVLGNPPAASAEPWRLLTAMFLHSGIDHLFGNVIALYILGMACEHAYGFRRVASLYVLSGVGASVVSILVSPGPSVGASGAIFGLMGAGIFFFRKYGEHFILRDNRVGIVLIIWALYSIATGFMQPFIDNGAHVGGLMTGAALAFFVRPQLLDTLEPGQGAKETIVPRAFGS